jgi:hypothetical protein
MLTLNERLVGLLVVVLVISLVVWLNLPKLLWPAFILTIIALAIYRERHRRQKSPHGKP